MITDINRTRSTIEAYDRLSANQISIDVNRFLTCTSKGSLGPGRIIRVQHPHELHTNFDPKHERLATSTEIMRFRVRAFNMLVLTHQDPDSLLYPQSLDQTTKALENLRHQMDDSPEIASLWRLRLTTSSHLVRTTDAYGKDSVFFYHGNPFETSFSVESSVAQGLSDGGIKYSDAALAKVRSATENVSRMPYDSYLSSPGGSFSGSRFLDHPVFSHAAGDPVLMTQYVGALQILSHLNYYNRAKHSGWRPSNMSLGYGRPIALGAVGEAFYPPNYGTIDHAGLVLQLKGG